GRFFPDGLRLTSVVADFSVVPDGTFVNAAAFRQGRVRLVKGKRGGYVELEGIPNMGLGDSQCQFCPQRHRRALRTVLGSWDSRILVGGCAEGTASIRYLPPHGQRLRRHAQASRPDQVSGV